MRNSFAAIEEDHRLLNASDLPLGSGRCFWPISPVAFRGQINAKPFLELGPLPFLSGRLAKSNAGSAPVLIDKFDAGGFERAAHR
jgi:hypothetical protein